MAVLLTTPDRHPQLPEHAGQPLGRTCCSDAVHDQALSRFLEHIRGSFSHDLRTPLGTIVNYAGVLEAQQGVNLEDVHNLGLRIRENALRVARMVQQLATATGLANRAQHATATDLAVLARSVLVDAGGRGDVAVNAEPAARVKIVDAEILGFAWRAFVAVEADASAGPVHELALEIHEAHGAVLVELRRGNASPPDANTAAPAALEVGSYLRHNGGSARVETSMSFSLAQDLVFTHGGELGVWGRPGAGSGLRVRLPATG
jgi:K+-sensing histidine kinase KdpD